WTPGFNEVSNTSPVYVKKWNEAATAWEGIGGSDTDGGLPGTWDAHSPCIKVDGSGNPTVGWSDTDRMYGLGEILVSRWDGNQWATQIVPPSGSRVESREPSLALDSGGAPFVAWHEYPS